MTKIKICGLTRLVDIESVNRWLPDYIGFVFSESRRQLTPEQSTLLKAGLDDRIKAVGVFVNEPLNSIIKLSQSGVIDVVQLHGDEDEAYIRQLKQQIDSPVVKAVRVQSSEQIRQTERLPCDLLLLDAYQKNQYGGSGKTFDHALIPNLQKPFFLAGGLDSSNIVKAIRQLNPYGVDISSGVEIDGLKDDSKIRQIIQTVRSINSL